MQKYATESICFTLNVYFNIQIVNPKLNLLKIGQMFKPTLLQKHKKQVCIVGFLKERE